MSALEQALLTWVHLISASIWVGGSLFIGVVFSPLLKTMADSVEDRMKIMIRVGRRFNMVAIPALGILVATGLYSSHALLARPELLAATSYGTFLAVKVGLVAALVAAYVAHVRIISKGVEEKIMSGALSTREVQRLRKKIIILGEVTVAISVAILLFAALLDAGV
ncbi:MAG: CopD family protein [Thaumarchaeota archaeon]|nr:CopD family protein [Nitrososphaerota archaeon]MDE0265517.1 CopD family protein [Nitrososphaerota archaeon]MDE0525986.1 CopD family protein [Nitrososphaerota archaeon]